MNLQKIDILPPSLWQKSYSWQRSEIAYLLIDRVIWQTIIVIGHERNALWFFGRPRVSSQISRISSELMCHPGLIPFEALALLTLTARSVDETRDSWEGWKKKEKKTKHFDPTVEKQVSRVDRWARCVSVAESSDAPICHESVDTRGKVVRFIWPGECCIVRDSCSSCNTMDRCCWHVRGAKIYIHVYVYMERNSENVHRTTRMTGKS